MNVNRQGRLLKQQRGFSLIEILVTIIIMMIGLLGLAGLQGKALTSQLESYQRSQALILVQDMANRMSANRANIAQYVTQTPLGTGATCPSAASSVSSIDLNQWCQAIMGAGEVQSGVAASGAMIGARGCVSQDVPGSDGVPAQYTVTVVWQGVVPTVAPASSCGSGLYGDDALRRALSMPVFVADLD